MKKILKKKLTPKKRGVHTNFGCWYIYKLFVFFSKVEQKIALQG